MVLDWLLGDNLWALGIFYLIEVFCMPEAWGHAILLDKIN